MTLYIYYIYILYFLFFTIFSFFFHNCFRILNLFFYSTITLSVITLFFFFNKSLFFYQFYAKLASSSLYNTKYVIGIDGLSIILVLLSTYIIYCCLLNFWHLRYQMQMYVFLLTLTLLFLIHVFTVLDFFFFFIAFEAVVIPLFLIVGI